MNHFIPTLMPMEFCKTVEAYEINHVRLGAWLRNQRKGFKISIREIARRMKLSAQYISDLEKGKRNWSMELYMKYVEAFNV